MLLSLWELMRTVSTWNLLWAAHVFGGIGDPWHPDAVVGDDVKKDVGRLAEAIREECRALGFKASWASAGRIVKLASKGGATNKEFAAVCGEEFFGRLADEISMTSIFAISSDHEHLIRTPNLFGPEVADAFPSAIQDVEEAGKCLAFGRSTACVFHLMRVMEHGLRVLGDSLNEQSLDANKNPTWDRILDRADRELAKTADKRTDGWRKKGDFFADAIANLRAVKVAWRNPSMHVRGTYDPEKAQDIWNAVGGFMRQLARELKEGPVQ